MGGGGSRTKKNWKRKTVMILDWGFHRSGRVAGGKPPLVTVPEITVAVYPGERMLGKGGSRDNT